MHDFVNCISLAWIFIECSSKQKDEDVESFRMRFAGSQAERIVKAETDANKVAEQLKATKITGRVFLTHVIKNLLFFHYKL